MQSDSRSVIESFSRSIIRSCSHTVGQSSNHSVSHQVMQSDSRPVIESFSRSDIESFSQSSGQTVGQSSFHAIRLGHSVGLPDMWLSTRRALWFPSQQAVLGKNDKYTTFRIRDARFTARDFPFLSAERPRTDETTTVTTSPESGRRNV
ncbi:hypothetical protein L798_14009 [Zootermopsis nevadensis]|uniref:Uncharacterized protein n=1 Tax=Zootermopsis nevadensis TaxID=136037 RepID=A0A067QT71_ZOONE|nr:hypothetical protein L798_14009 [Zootermopsis nevadensis]